MANHSTRAAELPPPAVYDEEIKCWPWQRLLTCCAEIISSHAPKDGTALDYMCGTGRMLNEVRGLRGDLTLVGCDISRPYVSYARRKGGGIRYVASDAVTWRGELEPDIITATAGLHHLPWAKQSRFVEKVARELRPGGLFIIGEEALPRHDDGFTREKSVVELYSAIIPEVLANTPSRDVVRATLEVFANDLLVRGEFKRDLVGWKKMLAPRFKVVETIRIWPARESGFGDYLIVAQRR